MQRAILTLATVTWMATAFLVAKYDKLGAEWFGIPVVIVGLVACAAIGFAFTRLPWYQNPSSGVPEKMIVVLVIAIILAPTLGIFFTEPIEPGGDLTQSDVTFRDYDYHDTRMGGWYYVHVYGSDFLSSSSSTSSSSSSSVDLGDDAGEALAYLFIVLIVVAIVLASAFVPHFWVVALMILITLTILIALREGSVAEYQEKHRYNRRW